MPDWRRLITRLRKRLAQRLGGNTPAPRPLPLADGETAGSLAHLQRLLAGRPAPFAPPAEGRIVMAEEGGVALAVESCMAVPGGGIAVAGWLSDPHGLVAGSWIEVDGTFRPARIASRTFRHDVVEQRGLMNDFPDHRTGFTLFETCLVEPGRRVTVNLHAIARTPHGFVVLSSGTSGMPGAHCSLQRLAQEFKADRADPTMIAAAAEPFLKGLARVQAPMAWRERRIEAASGEQADLSVVIVIRDNADLLHYQLAALEACRHAGRLEIILALETPGIETDVRSCVRQWRGSSPFAAIKTLVPAGAVGFGLAASGGIASAQGAAIALVSDEILPPNGNWVGTALELLAHDPKGVLIPPVASFDHRPVTFASAFDLAWPEFEHDHSGLRDLMALAPVRKGLAWSCGVVLAGRELLEAPGGLDDSLTECDICLLELVLRMQHDGTARLQPLPRAFTHLRLPAYEASHSVARLWSLHALAAMIRRRTGDPEPDEPRQAASTSAPLQASARLEHHPTGS